MMERRTFAQEAKAAHSLIKKAYTEGENLMVYMANEFEDFLVSEIKDIPSYKQMMKFKEKFDKKFDKWRQLMVAAGVCAAEGGIQHEYNDCCTTKEITKMISKLL